jgi:hypothetical protein
MMDKLYAVQIMAQAKESLRDDLFATSIESVTGDVEQRKALQDYATALLAAQFTVLTPGQRDILDELRERAEQAFTAIAGEEAEQIVVDEFRAQFA